MDIILVMLVFPFIICGILVFILYRMVKKTEKEMDEFEKHPTEETEEEKKFYSTEHIIKVEGQILIVKASNLLNKKIGSGFFKSTGRILRRWIDMIGDDFK